VSRAFEVVQLQIRYDGEILRVAAPSLHFLTGAPLERLKDGDSVAYLASLELLDESRNLLRQHKGRFVVSYALWEEKFSVTQLGGQTVDGLSAQAAETWCLDSLAVNTAGFSPSRYYYLRFGIRTATAREIAASTGLSLRDLIAALGKKNTEQTEWGPLERRVRLSDLPRLSGRGSHA